jgi:hypothetical protein
VIDNPAVFGSKTVDGASGGAGASEVGRAGVEPAPSPYKEPALTVELTAIEMNRARNRQATGFRLIGCFLDKPERSARKKPDGRALVGDPGGSPEEMFSRGLGLVHIVAAC